MTEAPILTPRLLSREEAAAYVGLSARAFDEEVAAGTFPAAFRLRRIRRSIREAKFAVCVDEVWLTRP